MPKASLHSRDQVYCAPESKILSVSQNWGPVVLFRLDRSVTLEPGLDITWAWVGTGNPCCFAYRVCAGPPAHALMFSWCFLNFVEIGNSFKLPNPGIIAAILQRALPILTAGAARGPFRTHIIWIVRSIPKKFSWVPDAETSVFASWWFNDELGKAAFEFNPGIFVHSSSR